MARLTKKQRVLLQNLLTYVSFLITVAGTALWWRMKSAGDSSPLWLLGVIGYGWTFLALLLMDKFGRRVARKRRSS
ncbi:hypothetical protein [Tumebacillus flagellatus]|uniref:Uncharacterized protein n=1 Tax=Tumebacillus flagellatus TaxID=1157490 RepID=A0A074MCC1_9BACL|nr:hypothetical protein [Tumebacillus flagellatus]KEO83532.1 hypothetical protein EL26_08945 [Tumebacillus flagellatus]